MSNDSAEKGLQDLTLADLEGMPDEDIAELTGARLSDDPWDVVTPPEALARMAQSRHAHIREAVAGNPSAAEYTLKALARDNIPAVRAAVAGSRSAASDLLSVLATDPSSMVRAAAAINPRVPRACLGRLLEESHATVLRALRSNGSVPMDVREAALERLVSLDDEDTLVEFARDQDADQEILTWLARSKHTAVRAQVAAHRRTPVKVLEKLADDDMWFVFYRVSTNLSAPSELRANLARLIIQQDPFSSPTSVASFVPIARTTESPEILHLILQKDDRSIWDIGTLAAIGANSHATEDVLQLVASKLISDGSRLAKMTLAGLPALEDSAAELLVNDELLAVRRTLAKHATKPSAAMYQLAADSEPQVRTEIARNPNTTEDILEMLAEDPDWRVLVGLARNPRTPPRLLMVIADRRYRSVLNELALRPDLPGEIATAIHRNRRSNAASDSKGHRGSHTPEAPVPPVSAGQPVSVEADSRQHSHIRPLDEAQSRHTSEKRMLWLAGHSDTWIRMLLAGNPSAACSVLSLLAKDPEHVVRTEVAKNRNANRCGLVQELACDPHEAVRSAIATRRDLPRELLQALAKDRRARVRSSAADNPRLPRSILRELMNDRSKEVVRVAEKALAKRM